MANLETCYVLAPFFVAFLGDTLSMFAGRLFGKRKLAPHVSPKKTIAGGIGGLSDHAGKIALQVDGGNRGDNLDGAALGLERLGGNPAVASVVAHAREHDDGLGVGK